MAQNDRMIIFPIELISILQTNLQQYHHRNSQIKLQIAKNDDCIYGIYTRHKKIDYFQYTKVCQQRVYSASAQYAQ
jgi:hypothetical protein